MKRRKRPIQDSSHVTAFHLATKLNSLNSRLEHSKSMCITEAWYQEARAAVLATEYWPPTPSFQASWAAAVEAPFSESQHLCPQWMPPYSAGEGALATSCPR